jgi:hypothetical protein
MNKLPSLTVGLIRLVFGANLHLLFFLLHLHIYLFRLLFPLQYFLLSLFLFSFLCLSASNPAWKES